MKWKQILLNQDKKEAERIDELQLKAHRYPQNATREEIGKLWNEVCTELEFPYTDAFCSSKHTMKPYFIQILFFIRMIRCVPVNKTTIEKFVNLYAEKT